MAQALRDLARGEQTASALEANLTALESKLDELLASFEASVDEEMEGKTTSLEKEVQETLASLEKNLPGEDGDKKPVQDDKKDGETS